MKISMRKLVIRSLVSIPLLIATAALAEQEHFHPKGKAPSTHTLKVLDQARAALPFADRRDFEENERGFIAAPDSMKIMAKAGHVAWDMGRYEFLLEGRDFDSIHPSLQRQAILNMAYGLYEVIPGIYQVRGFDLSNISFIRGDTGWIVFDPLTSAETARAALALVNEKLGERPVVAVVYSHTHPDHYGGVRGVVAGDRDGIHEIRAGGVVLACGGFEANPEMRVKYLGGGWERAKVRGTRFNTGDGHRAALDVGAKAGGQWTGCHATPIDIEAPKTGELEVTDRMPRRSYPLGIMVNLSGRRFVDEGEGFAEQTFVKVGTRILEQERGLAFQVFDAKARPMLEPRYGVATAVEASDLGALAERLGVNTVAFRGTVEAFNAEAQDGEYVPRKLDGRATKNLDPPKSNWAIRIDTPPFVAFTVTGGITYTYGGLSIESDAQVLDLEDRPIPGLFAAGEIVGGIFYHNSLRAAGLMHGAVFGKLAGAGAAKVTR